MLPTRLIQGTVYQKYLQIICISPMFVPGVRSLEYGTFALSGVPVPLVIQYPGLGHPVTELTMTKTDSLTVITPYKEHEPS